ncbi:MAG TPA: cytochrome-c oxidase, cbb3-type subunit I [Edaphocola sp.]|nr:cytochrome-c oxidase, cbb3-type subunit I [Edaphocola sp.]
MVQKEQFYYDNKIVKQFGIATIVWGIIGMLVGVYAALEIAFPGLNFGIPYITFGRLRPIHTNAVIFAFVGNAVFAGSYYIFQRVLKARMYSDFLGKLHLWGWQLIIVLGAISLSLGYTTSKEYAELEWPIDILITIVWVIYGINMLGTMLKRRERHMYVAIWFFIGTWVAVAMLHIVNSMALPYSAFGSYSAFAGVKDALVQWWYGHNAVAFFLTTPMLGLMYYFVPKAANRPVYSYRWSIIHFWALIFIYIWAGPHHLLYTALPSWAQALGTVFSIMLILPSWGGMLNGLFTIRGAWENVKTDPILKMFIVALTCYGMATLEGPLLSIKSINAISHYTDWTIAHVHVGALGFNGFLIFGMLYWLIPKMWNTELHSKKMANSHFLIGTVGILLYAIPLYWAAFTQSLMWKQFTESGQLKYQFLETVTHILPAYMLRSLGGLLYLTGTILMAINLRKTMLKGKFQDNELAEAVPFQLLAKPEDENFKTYWHNRVIERRPILLTVLSLIAVGIGGLVELTPSLLVDKDIPVINAVKPYTALELVGRDIYVREGCYTCHSQMVRPFRDEIARYGEYSKAGEFIYDRPFQWGSKRTGPDLHRVGGKYLDSWHYMHMDDPQSTSAGSLMPHYPWLLENKINNTHLPSKIKTLQKLGVPYPEGYANKALEDYDKQAKEVVARLHKENIKSASADKEIIALIAYLQRLGTDIKKLDNDNKDKVSAAFN